MKYIKKILDFNVKGSVIPVTLVASAILGVLTIVGTTFLSDSNRSIATMRLDPSGKVVSTGTEFEIKLVVESSIPVNVFAGEIHFESNLLKITKIDYDTSIADLWAELPWFSNGEGTLTFGGGSTQSGGFRGSGSLITVRFQSLDEGSSVISIRNPRILLHDGLGTDSQVEKPIDAIITIEDEAINNLVIQMPPDTIIVVKPDLPTTDLNGDGKQSIADISIFMLNMGAYNERFDFNADGLVNLKDLNILLSAQ